MTQDLTDMHQNGGVRGRAEPMTDAARLVDRVDRLAEEMMEDDYREREGTPPPDPFDAWQPSDEDDPRAGDAHAEEPKAEGVKPDWSSMADRLRRTQSAGPRHPTGIEPLDKHLRGGLRSEKVVIVGGAPGAGKTSKCAQIARHWARNGVAVAWVAIDEETAGIDARNLQSIGVAREKAEEPDEDTVRLAEAEFGHLPLHPFDDCAIEDAFEWLAERYPDQPRAVFVDSLQTARTRTSALIDSIRERIGHIVSTAKAYARAEKTRAIVVFTSELARGAYRSKQTADQIEDLAAFKESGAIEYQGHVLLVLRTAKGDAALTHVSIPKNRTGTKGEFGLRFDFETATFTPEDIADDGDSARLDEFDALCDRVLEVVRQNPGISGRRVRVEVGAKAQGVYAALEKLEANGAIRNTAKGRSGAKWTALNRAVETEQDDQ